jgi:hypothetical protein
VSQKLSITTVNVAGCCKQQPNTFLELYNYRLLCLCININYMYVLGGFWIENDSHSRPVGGGDSANNIQCGYIKGRQF